MTFTELLSAAARGDAESVTAILDRDPLLTNQLGELPGHTGMRTALHFGVHHPAVVRALLERRADPNIRDEGDHAFPIHFAAERGELDTVRMLVEHGADPGLEDAVGLTPLDAAALNGDNEMVRTLLEAGARVTLPAAIALGRDVEVERLVRDDPELLSTTDKRRWVRILVHASAGASAAVVERFLRVVMRHRSGLSIVNMEDDRETAIDGAGGFTALHAAAFAGNDDVVRLLLRHGADPRARERKYCGTPAGWAAYAGHAATAGLILDADVDVFDAIDFDRADRIAQIVEGDPGAIDRPFGAYASCGGPLRSPDMTPLEWATKREKARAREALIACGAATRSRACSSTAAPTRTTSTWRATRATRS